jgi:hypothetical protein
MENLFNQYQNYVIMVIAFVVIAILAKLDTVRDFVKQSYSTIVEVVKFFASSLSEADGNGGKPSFSRMLGVYITFQIVSMSWITLYDTTRQVPDVMMTIFWVTIGYAMLSKVIATASPLLQDIIRAYLIKVQNVPAQKA